MSREIQIRRRLQTRVALRLFGICLFGCLTGFLIFDSPYWMAGIWTALITVILFLETIRFVIQSEQKLTAFLQALRQNDFAITFSENQKADNYDLHRAFNQLNEIFKKLRSEKESQHHLLQTVVENTNSPLICFDENTGDIYFVNNAAKNLFQIPFLQKIDSLRRIDNQLLQTLIDIKDGQRLTEKLTVNGRISVLSIYAQHVLFDNKNLKLLSIHDISSELAAKESETWQKLLRVLTHEISNSAIPLSTLSKYIYDLVMTSRAEKRDLTDEERQDIMESLKTIDQRSRSLKEFVQNFKAVGQIPEPRIEKVAVSEIIQDAVALFEKDFKAEGIQCTIGNLKDLTIQADRNLTQQVLINILKNGVEAMSNMKHGKAIEITAEKEGRGYVHVLVRDTGAGISNEDQEQIFIPFYSTKKGGSGIGLSISKQIMQKQKGDIFVQSEQGKGSSFTVSFTAA